MRLHVITREPQADPRSTPVLFVHGSWHGAWCWAEHFLPYFAHYGYVSHALDLRGHGRSAGHERLRWTSIGQYVADVAEVVSQLARPSVLIGHSMGGLIVQKYLEFHPAPAAVLLASVPPSGALRTALSIAVRHPLPFLKANLTLTLYPLVGTPDLAREAFFSAEMPAERVKAYHAYIQDESYRAFIDMLLLSLPRPERVKTPMLVLGAGRDMIFTPQEVRATARAYATHAQIFPNMAHDMMLENGWQAVADHILTWLREKGL